MDKSNMRLIGFNDKDGTPIKEGDILDFYFPEYKLKCRGYVFWDSDKFMHTNYDLDCNGNVTGVFGLLKRFWLNEGAEIKIIGNVFDNPELLGTILEEHGNYVISLL